MSQQIYYDEEKANGEDFMNENENLVDAYVPPYGWIPVIKLGPETVRLLHVDAVQSCTRIAPLYTRSMRDEDSDIWVGQGVQILDEADPGATWRPAAVEALEDFEVIVRTLDGTTRRVPTHCVKPLVQLRFNSNTASTSASSFERRAKRPAADHDFVVDEADEALQLYRKSLREFNLEIVPIAGDGNCMFRAASHQIYGTDSYHTLIRLTCAEYMTIEKQSFEPFLTEVSDRVPGRRRYEGFENYIHSLRMDGTWGDDPELQAICEIYQRSAEIFVWDRSNKRAKVLRKFFDEDRRDAALQRRPLMRFSFVGGGHYDSIVEIGSAQQQTRPRPGELEKRALEIAKSRRAGGVSMATKISDALETEKVALETALEVSAQQGDATLQAALEQSLRNTAIRDQEELELARLKSLQEAEDEALARALEQSRATANDQTYPYLAGAGDEDDEEVMIRLAIEESLKSNKS